MDKRYFSMFWRFYKKKDNEESDEWYFCEVYIEYLEKLHKVRIDLSLKKLLADSSDKTEYVIHTRRLKQALNPGLVLKRSS